MIDSSAIAAVGEAAAKLEISKWGWAFRLQPERDYGIDAHAELIAGAYRSGKLIALQIKTGHSYFEEAVDGGWVYRDGDGHLRYWLGHCLPVVLLLHDLDSGATYWVHITADAIQYTETEWKIVVPSSQVLGCGAVGAFTALANSAPGAADDPLERSCAVLPPSVARILSAAEPGQEAGALRLAAVLATGRTAAPMAARSMLAGEPSWMPAGKGRAMAACGQLPAAVAMLRGHAARSPIAAEILVDVLDEAGRYDEALDEAARGFDRFGESILAHKRLNLLVLAGRPDDAAAEAQRLLARTDTAPELRQKTRQRLIIHYACAGDWAAAEEQARAALGEFPGSAGFPVGPHRRHDEPGPPAART